jgi:hypothetical protein
MDGFVVHDVAPDVSVQVTREMPALASGLDAVVEALWRRACQRVSEGGAGTLFNGRVFSADRITPSAITGHLTEFRRIVAQMDDPALFDTLGVRPLAVCGVLCCADGVVVGRRPPGAVYQPGLWQLPPAGSVDAGAVGAGGEVDLARQVLTELGEELGLDAFDVSEPRPLCVVEHPGSRVCDLGMALTTRLGGDAVLAAHAARGNNEYDPLHVVPFDRLASFAAEAGETIVPPARIFLRRVGLLA